MSEAATTRRALICGVGGQDGAYLARFLLGKGYEVVGSSRDATSMNRLGLKSLDVDGRVQVVSMAPNDFRSVLQTITRTAPDEIYNLSGQSSVGLSFDQPVETIESIAIGTLNLLESIRFVERPIGFYNAGSSECFGDTGDRPADESTPFRPRSPYAVAKACAHNLVVNYREAYQMRACTGILFNHESPLRAERFVTQKIVRAACRIAAGKREKLRLGNLDIHRDWGWAPEYVEVMWLMLQQAQPEDFVIATGRSASLEYFVERAFAGLGLAWREHVEQDTSLLRPTDIRYGAADPTRATRRLGWKARHDVDEVIAQMSRAEQERLSQAGAGLDQRVPT
ncbi:MAG: GDP-mannose 4,6-dehydratase [Burkholderiales bacterium]|nr:GDP-mannose 4,6-dehydratase [Burkholderiales bacterium]